MGLKCKQKNILQGTTRIIDYKQVRYPGFFKELLKKNQSLIEEGQATNTDENKRNVHLLLAYLDIF